MLFRLVEGFGGFDGERALHAAAEEVASVRIYAVDVACGVPCVRGAAARTIQPRPAIVTLGLGIGIAAELMAGIELPRGSHSHILRAGAAPRYALVNTRSVFQVQHIMIEHERCTIPPHLDHALGEKLVLLHDDLLVLFGEGAGRIGWSDHRLPS